MKRTRKFWLMAIAVFGLLGLYGCGGGGSDQPASTQAAQQTATPTVSIAGKVVINGVDDYSGVVVVAEKTSGGVTARVQRMLDAAAGGSGQPAARLTAREALSTPGVFTTQTDSSGNYQFADIPAGKYSISAYKESTLAAQPRIVEATTAGQSVTVDFELVATGSIKGRFNLAPSYSASHIYMVYLKGTSYVAYADDNKEFTITNVPVGSYSIVFTINGSQRLAQHANVTVAAGATTSDASASVTIACNSNYDCLNTANSSGYCTNGGTEQATCDSVAYLANEWISVPAGDFVMGCATGDTYCAIFPSESPKHTVTLSAYKIQKYEVTQAQYKTCVDAGICQGGSYSGTTINHPVTSVTWTQASTYCAWIGGRLPTEAEWEKAARGPAPREVIYPWGNAAPSCSLLNYHNGTNFCVGNGSATVVGSYPSGASYYGALDMAGNVWEWVNDWYDPSYYASSPATDPQGPVTGALRALRGGSFGAFAEFARVSFRFDVNPDYTNYLIGFRCAQD